MIIFTVLIVVTVLLGFILHRFLQFNLNKQEEEFLGLKRNKDGLVEGVRKLKLDSEVLKNNIESTVALFEITKKICESLQEEKVFTLFIEEINKYIKTADCRFVKDQERLKEYADYLCVPLEIDNKAFGFLLASGVPEEDREKFNILSQQFVLGIKRAILYHQVQELAITDGLTGVLSRRYWQERFKQEIERSKNLKLKFSFLMVDVDNFKAINDHYGHLVGDATLKEVARRIKENIRQVDLVCRYGVEEFSVVLVETDREGALLAAERIRKAVESVLINVYDEQLKATISIGISVFPEDSRAMETLIDDADQALYQAKSEGRNRICIYKKGA